jgi:hypothetical protein
MPIFAFAMSPAGSPIPPPLLLRGLIDTGSDVSVVVPSVPRHFGLAPFQSRSTQGTTGSAPVHLYEMSLSIINPGGPGPSMLSWERLLVMEAPAGLPGVDVIVGLDVLRECLLISDGPGPRFTLAI